LNLYVTFRGYVSERAEVEIVYFILCRDTCRIIYAMRQTLCEPTTATRERKEKGREREERITVKNICQVEQNMEALSC
jgi:hypothetical protein